MVYVCVSWCSRLFPASLSQTCPFYHLADHSVDHRMADRLPLFFPMFFLGFCMKPSRVSALRWQVGPSCQANGELAWAGTLLSYLFHHPWHRFLWLAVTWPWSDGSAARCAMLHSDTCTTLLPALSGNLSAWVAKRAHYARYYHIAALGEVAKCSRVWYAVRYPCTPGMFVPASGWDKVENPNQGL